MKKMRCKIIFAMILMVGLALLCNTTASQAAEKQIVLRTQTAWSAGFAYNDFHNRQMDMIEKISGGRVKFERHYSGELCPSFEVWKAAGKGVIDVGFACNCYTIGRSYASAFFCSAPSWGPVEKLAWLFEGGGLPILQDMMKKKYNVMTLPAMPTTTEVFLYSRKSINSVDDLKKLKIRSAGIRGDVFKAAGASVVTLPLGDLIPAMEKGVVDAAEFSNLFADVPFGFQDVCNYIYLAPTANAPHIMMILNLDTWNKLPKDIQQIFKEVGIESSYYTLGKTIVDDFLTMEKIGKTSDVKILSLPKEVDDYINQTAKKLYAEKEKEDPDLKRVLDSINHFLDPEKQGRFIPLVDDLF